MKIAATVLAALGTALIAGAQSADWGDSTEEIANSPEFESSKALCRDLRNREPPEADRPTARQAAALRDCDSEALYYGIGGPADPVRARQCAFLEAERETGAVLAGRAMLMTIYANGVGAERDLDVAIHLACGLDGAPMESHGRVTHLAELRASGWTGNDFHYCDDITSGISMGHCAGHEAAIAEARRAGELQRLTADWSPRERQLLAPLQQALQAYVEAHGEGEIDLSGTARAAMQIGAMEAQHEAFVQMLQRLEAGRAPLHGRGAFQAADAALNAAYRERLRGEFYGSPGAVTRDGIRAAQRAWLRFRDAFLRFAAVKYPRVTRDGLATLLTRQRTELLQREE